MRKNGFTLVELLAVIVILAVVLLIAVPGVLGIIKKTREDAYKSQLRIVTDAARNYVAAERTLIFKDYGTKKQAVVTLDMMKQNGYLDKKIIDPRDKSEITDLSVLVTQLAKKERYEIVYNDSSNANYPTYSGNMIPIRYDGTNWVKADVTNKDLSWFDYSKQKWANIATVSEDVRSSLLNAKTGTVVPISKINAMYVWIPRYRYKLFNVDGSTPVNGNPNLAGEKSIAVEFQTVSDKKEVGTKNGEYLTHPAFTFGDEELSGFWVGKFETAIQTDDPSTYVGSVSIENIVDASRVRIVPNQHSWKFSNLANFYRTSRSMNQKGNVFGLSELDDSHLIKNMEWGAMAYLTLSKYGKTGNPNYSGDQRKLTGNPTQITGRVGVAVEDTYNTATGMKASTTGNITGIYDASGGSFEYTMSGLIQSDINQLPISNSGFTIEEVQNLVDEGKYMDVYSAPSTTQMDNFTMMKLGDATLELGPLVKMEVSNRYYSLYWYSENALSFRLASEWLARGGAYDYGGLAGIAAFAGYDGSGSGYHGSRIIIS